MNRYFKWPVASGEAFAKVPLDYAYPNMIGSTETVVVSIALNDPLLVEITESEWGEWAKNKKWRALSGS